MKLPFLFGAAALALAAGMASADTIDRTTTTICLDAGGQQRPATCKSSGGGSRINQQEDICICPGPTMQVKAPLCPAGVAPPAESAAYERARLKAVSHGSLVGATWQGKPMCVAPHAG